jgi:hypothetical protein
MMRDWFGADGVVDLSCLFVFFVFSPNPLSPFPPKYVSINKGISWIKPATRNTRLQAVFTGPVD